jgi:hypothetical protein
MGEAKLTESNSIANASTYTQGTYLGTLQHVKHWDVIGWVPLHKQILADLMGKDIFQPIEFYTNMMGILACLELIGADEWKRSTPCDLGEAEPSETFFNRYTPEQAFLRCHG